jgi:hypothetical protein
MSSLCSRSPIRTLKRTQSFAAQNNGDVIPRDNGYDKGFIINSYWQSFREPNNYPIFIYGLLTLNICYR